jgi:2,4-dienoyl-CoA reductase-like NADH-dependent reductase (Old Yellow Enzyme family)
MEIIENIKEKCGKDYPVLYRMSAVEYVPGGLEIEESKILARLVEEAGADCIHCSQGVYASTHVIIPPSVVPRAAYVENAAEIKKVVDIPVGYTHNIINEGDTDLVTFMWCNECFDPQKPDTYVMPVNLK